MIGVELKRLRDELAARPGWGTGTVGRLSTRVNRQGVTEWLAVVFVAPAGDQRKATHARAGVGETAEAALEALRTRIQERNGTHE